MVREEKGRWMVAPQTGLLPSCRHSHCLQITSNGQLVVLLGHLSSQENRLYVYSAATHSW